MSQTFFSKVDQAEKDNRLSALANNKGKVTVWIKGQKEKKILNVISYDKERSLIILDTQINIFSPGTALLCSFEFRGKNFFATTIFQKSIGDFACLKVEGELYKAEKRTSFRLMTFPLYEIWAEFKLDEAYEGGKIIDFKSKQSTTAIFNNFLSLVDGNTSDSSMIKIRVQDLSTTGMALHVGELEEKFFPKDALYRNVRIKFSDDEILIPELKILYAVNYVGSDKNLKKFKVGIHFENLSHNLDHWLGKKINSLLRESDHNKDFENFKK